MIDDDSFIITPDRFLSLSHDYISRYGTKFDFDSTKNIIFVKPDFLDDFVVSYLPKINYPFVLITHDSDHQVNVNHLAILNHPYLKHWFGMNCHILHDKLTSIPIGMANEVWPHGDKQVVLKVINEQNEKKNLVYCNFDIKTNTTARHHTLSVLQNTPFIDFEFNRLTFEEYLRKLGTYKYVISPPGNSTDCHRIWESIYVGTIPICLKSIPLVGFKSLPILFINQWQDITVDLLEEKYKLIKERSKEKSDFNFYSRLIKETSNL
jgi:hypothetical protein